MLHVEELEPRCLLSSFTVIDLGRTDCAPGNGATSYGTGEFDTGHIAIRTTSCGGGSSTAQAAVSNGTGGGVSYPGFLTGGSVSGSRGIYHQTSPSTASYVTGYSTVSGGDTHAFYYDGVGMTDVNPQ